MAKTKIGFTKQLAPMRVYLFATALVCICFGLAVGQEEPAPGPRTLSLHSGDPNAPVKIEVYYDLQCPACTRFHKILKETEEAYPGKIFVTFRQWPLNLPAHDKAIRAARVVEAANMQGRGREMLDLVMDGQKTWSVSANAKTILFGYARKLGLDMEKFDIDYDDDEAVRPVIEDSIRANRLKLTYTPTVLVNGQEWSFIDALDLKSKVKQLVQ